MSSSPLKFSSTQCSINHEKNICAYSLQNAHDDLNNINDLGRKERFGNNSVKRTYTETDYLKILIPVVEARHC